MRSAHETIMGGMRIGYACINTQLPTSARTIRLANATPERLRETTAGNLDALGAVLRWNADHGIQVFRLTSNLVPFASHPVNTLPWWEEHATQFAELGRIVRANDMRLSMHPGPYTVIASANPDVVASSAAELAYHDRVLGLLGVDEAHKIVLHVGGRLGSDTGERFLAGLAHVPDGARARLVLENDERWPLADVLALAREAALPVAFDVFHHTLAPSFPDQGVRELVERAASTWAAGDGRPELHFSTQDPGKRPGAHAESVDLQAFASFVDEVGDLSVDCILEVKDKEQSVLRAQPLLDRARR